MDRNLIIPPQDNLYMILDTKEFVKSLNDIHMDLCNIQATMIEQNDLLDKLVNPHHDLFEDNGIISSKPEEEEKIYKFTDTFSDYYGYFYCTFQNTKDILNDLSSAYGVDKALEIKEWCDNSKIGEEYRNGSIYIKVLRKET